MLSEWAVVALVAIILLGAVGLVFLGAWIGFRVKTVGTGMTLVQPSTPKNDGVASYVSELFEETDGVDLEEEDLSPAAKRIRDQKIRGPIADIIKEVEGK